MSAILPVLLEFFNTITPIAGQIVFFIVPIYITIGEIFANLGLIFVNWLSGDTALFPIIIAGVIGVLGLLAGFLSKTKEEKEEEQKKKNSEKKSSGPESAYEF